MRHNAILLVIFATLNACSSETATYTEATDDGAGGSDSSASSTFAVGTPQDGGAAPIAATTQAMEEVEPLCVPGQSVACACPDGASSAQVCAADGQSYGACDCGPAEVVTVSPAWYSGDCVMVGMSNGLGICLATYPYVRVNCMSAPSGCVTPQPGGKVDLSKTPGAYCCTEIS